MASPEKKETLDAEKIREALETLPPAQIGLLMKKAKLLSSGTGMQWKDLLQETFTRCLEGDRKCRSDVSVVTFLINAMRSISSHSRSTLANLPIKDQSEHYSLENSDEIESAINPSPSQDEILILEDLHNYLKSRFKDDPQALSVLRSKIEGWDKAETCELEDLTPLEYDASVRRVRRTIEREYRR